jgi:hypothetical protein
MGEQVVCGGGTRARTAGINSGSSSESHYCESEVSLFSLSSVKVVSMPC